MFFSLYINPQTPGPEADGAIIRASIEDAVLADQAGFRGIALTQHHFSDYNTYGNSFVFGAHLGARVSKAWLLMQVAVAPLLNPLVLVEDANLLDQLWEGRFLMGVSSGGSPLEFEGLGRDPATARELTAQVVDVADRAWRHRPGDGPFVYETLHDRGIMRGRINPSPYRDAPLLARAALSPEGWSDAGRKGRPLFFGRVGIDGARAAMAAYDSALRDTGWDKERIEFCKDWTTMQKTVLIADTDEEAHAAIDQPLGNLHMLSQKAFAAYGDEQRKKVTGVTGDDPAAFRKAFVEGATIIGSPETVIARLREYEAAGIRHVALHVNFGFMPRAVTQRTLDLFINKVMPAFS